MSFDQLIPGLVLPKISDAAEYVLLPFDEETGILVISERPDRVRCDNHSDARKRRLDAAVDRDMWR